MEVKVDIIWINLNIFDQLKAKFECRIGSNSNLKIKFDLEIRPRLVLTQTIKLITSVNVSLPDLSFIKRSGEISLSTIIFCADILWPKNYKDKI